MIESVTLRDVIWFICGGMFGCAMGILAMCVAYVSREPKGRDE